MKHSHVLRFLLLLLLTFLGPGDVVQVQEEVIMTISVESEHINVYQSTGVLVQLYTRAGEAVAGQEITFITDLGTIDSRQAVTNEHGEVWVTFVASSQTGVSHITSSARGLSETILVTVSVSSFQ